MPSVINLATQEQWAGIAEMETIGISCGIINLYLVICAENVGCSRPGDTTSSERYGI